MPKKSRTRLAKTSNPSARLWRLPQGNANTLHKPAVFPINSPASLLSFPMLSCFLALFVLVGTTFAQTATPPTAATVEVWPEGKMPGNGANAPEAEVPRKDGFHRITNVSRPKFTLFSL